MIRTQFGQDTFGAVVAILVSLLLSSAAWAQDNAAIAGTVTDTTSGVLPGVTVEASSPALIEGSRVVITDGTGQYRVVALRPGTYTVTFSLPGFSSVVREDIVLNAGFTANVDAELRVGAVEETVTVSGESPIVDVQNVRSQSVLTRDVLDTAPISKNFSSLADITVGVYQASGSTVDVGGVKGESYSGMAAHGGTIGFTLASGMRTNTATNWVTNSRYQHNQLSVEEVVLETGAVSAEALTGGVSVNMVPKEGGNTFSGIFLGEYAGSGMQGDNLSEEIRNRGLTESSKMERVHDAGVALGGPIARDRLWFYTAYRDWAGVEKPPGIFHNKLQHLMEPGNEAQGLRFEADRSDPAFNDNYTRDANLRLTWQATRNQKISVFGAVQDWCMCPLRYSFAPEAAYGFRFKPNNLYQTTWSYPANNRLLLEAGATFRKEHHRVDKFESTGNAISVIEQTLGTYGAVWSANVASQSQYGDHGNQGQFSTRVAASYVTGSHTFKAGVTTFVGENNIGGEDVANNQNYQYVYRNFVPVALNLAAFPHHHKSEVKMDFGLYAQDQWTIKDVTLNLGVRFDYLNGHVPAQCRPAGEFTPEFCFDAVENVPNWKDISPRVGVAYDLFGDGRTALKASLGRYVKPSTTQVTNGVNPAAAIAAGTSRTWTDTNGNYIPDCDLGDGAANGECGPYANQLFGTVLQQTRYAEDVTEGWHVREHNWQVAASVEHELLSGLGVKVGYYRTWWNNGGSDRYPGAGISGWVYDNLALTPGDFDEFCVSAPSDARLPGGGGYELCGLYDVIPDKFGQVDNLVTQVSHFGERTYVYDGIDASLDAAFGQGGHLYGGVSLGRIAADQCASPEVPDQFCEYTKGLAAHTQVKFSGSYPLPWDMQASGTFTNRPGFPLLARYSASNAEIASSLGRSLAGGARSRRIELIEPYTQFEDRMTRVDLRLAKNVYLGRVRMQARVDLYNVFNASTILRVNTSFGSRWRQPVDIMSARFVKFGFDMRF